MKLDIVEKESNVMIDEDICFMAWSLDADRALPSKGFVGTHSFIFVRKGSMKVRVNDDSYIIKAGDFADFVGKHCLHFVSASPDMEAYFLLLSESFDNIMFKDNPPFPISYPLLVNACQHPCYFGGNGKGVGRVHGKPFCHIGKQRPFFPFGDF